MPMFIPARSCLFIWSGLLYSDEIRDHVATPPSPVKPELSRPLPPTCCVHQLMQTLLFYESCRASVCPSPNRALWQCKRTWIVVVLEHWRGWTRGKFILPKPASLLVLYPLREDLGKISQYVDLAARMKCGSLPSCATVG